ncbi:hypothetical protein ACN5ZK_13580 (plasmid) [Macrococcoides bohemicum]|uniref:hypothetical protein n=1 Tax=Macrococcoides bohemicum TaxID=1903056 RepID=UPI003B002CFB
MKTVKELADKLGVAKQTINNNRPDEVPYKKINGMNYIDEQLEKLIIDNIMSKKVKSVKNSRTNEKSTSNTQYSKNSLKKILELDEQSYSDVENMLFNTDDFKDKLKAKEQEIEELMKKLSDYESLRMKLELFDNLLREKDERINDLKQDKQNLNSQLAMEQESLQNQQKLSLAQSQKIARLEQENKELNESLRVSYKQEAEDTDAESNHNIEPKEKSEVDPEKTYQSEIKKAKGFFNKLFGK